MKDKRRSLCMMAAPAQEGEKRHAASGQGGFGDGGEKGGHIGGPELGFALGEELGGGLTPLLLHIGRVEEEVVLLIDR
jgi:hypothetical protein